MAVFNFGSMYFKANDQNVAARKNLIDVKTTTEVGGTATAQMCISILFSVSYNDTSDRRVTCQCEIP